ncbi:MAG: adenylate/guanylate cyclase domain-containing protein [Pseudomonadota bacterium]
MSDTQPALLIVDDNEDNRYTLARRLKREGFENLTEAVNGQEALSLLKEQTFDLVLLDIMMPVLNGYETLEQMKSDMALRDTPVIMISAVDEIESVVRCIQLGAEDHLPKPFNAALLRARISASLEKKRLKDQQDSYLKQIEVEKKRADELLHATLPSAAVHELKTTNMVRPRRFEDVAVLFCDVVGFTNYCDQHAPEQVVAHLQELVNACEDIVARHGLEKIKTIGDAFMATAGLLQYVENPAVASVRAGFEIIDSVKKQDAGWDLRVGIHLGPVVAGVVGRKQYVFDLWGDTVNVASRIVEQAEPSSLLVSSPVWRALDNTYRGNSKGLVNLKGKGDLELIQCLKSA